MKYTIRNILLTALLTIGLGVPYLQAADVAISALPAAGTVIGDEQIPLVQSGATKKITVDALETHLIRGADTTEVLSQKNGSINGDPGFTFSSGNGTVDLGGGTVTASDPVLDLSQTWNNAAVAFTGVKVNITNTASAAASLLQDWQVGGSTVAAIRPSGKFLFGDDSSDSFFSFIGSDATNYSAIIGYENLAGANNVLARFELVGDAGRIIANNLTGNASVVLGDVYLYRDSAANTLAQRNSTTTQVHRVYNTYTDASNYERLALIPGAASGWMQVAAQTAGTGTNDIGVALTPAGTGAISAHVPDSTAAGGNARGAYAVDLQTRRSAADEVGSAEGAFVHGWNNKYSGGSYGAAIGVGNQVTGGNYGSSAIGWGNTVTGAHAIAVGSSNTASGRASFASGELNTASGNMSSATGERNVASGAWSWVPGGAWATTRSLAGAYAYSSGQRSALGDAQVIGQPVKRTTTDATPVSLATDGTPAATTVMVLPSDSTATCSGLVTANNNAAGVISMAGFKVDAIAKNDSSTITVSGGTCTAIGTADAALSTATCALVANGALDSIELQATGVAATTIYWVHNLECVQAL